MSREQRLRSMLDVYQAVSERDARFRSRMMTLLQKGESAFRHDHYEPGHFTASAFILSPDEASLLLILHAKLGCWLQPGGHVEPADGDLLVTARREALEEVGMSDLELQGDDILDVDIHLIPRLGRKPAHEHFDVRFLFRATTLEVTAASDAQQARWAALETLSEEGSDGSVTRAVARIRSM